MTDFRVKKVPPSGGVSPYKPLYGVPPPSAVSSHTFSSDMSPYTVDKMVGAKLKNENRTTSFSGPWTGTYSLNKKQIQCS